MEPTALPILFNIAIAAHRLIRDETPPMPACFDTRNDWIAYLLKVHESGACIVRREDTGKWSGNRHTRQVLVSPITRHCGLPDWRRLSAAHGP